MGKEARINAQKRAAGLQGYKSDINLHSAKDIQTNTTQQILKEDLKGPSQTIFYRTNVSSVLELIKEMGFEKKLKISSNLNRNEPFSVLSYSSHHGWYGVAYPNLELFYDNIYVDGSKVNVPNFHDTNKHFILDDEFETPDDAINGGEPELAIMLNNHLGKHGDESVVGCIEPGSACFIYFPKLLADEIDKLMLALYEMIFNEDVIYVVNDGPQAIDNLLSMGCPQNGIEAYNNERFFDLYDELDYQYDEIDDYVERFDM